MHFPHFWCSNSPILVALASLISISSPQWNCYILFGSPLSCTIVCKLPPGSNQGNHREGSHHVFPFSWRYQSCSAFCPKSANNCFILFCFLIVYIKGAIPVAVNNSWTESEIYLTIYRHFLPFSSVTFSCPWHNF